MIHITRDADQKLRLYLKYGMYVPGGAEGLPAPSAQDKDIGGYASQNCLPEGQVGSVREDAHRRSFLFDTDYIQKPLPISPQVLYIIARIEKRDRPISGPRLGGEKDRPVFFL